MTGPCDACGRDACGRHACGPAATVCDACRSARERRAKARDDLDDLGLYDSEPCPYVHRHGTRCLGCGRTA